MLTMTGLPAFCRARHIRSLASALPPGLSTRSTIALTVFSSAAWRTALMNVSEPSVSPPKKLVELLPDMMAPTACTTAILGFELRRFCCSPPMIRFIIFIMPPKPLKSLSTFFLP